MARILVLYDSHDGHAGVIAHAMAEVIRGRGHVADVRSAASLLDTFSVRVFDGAILGAQLRGGHYPAHFLHFVKENVRGLDRMGAWFFSESLDGPVPGARAQRSIERMHQQTGWSPQRVAHFAGVLRYLDYGLLKKLGMKLIARARGFATDTSRNHDYTDWPRVRAFAREFAQRFPADRSEIVTVPHVSLDELAPT